MKMLCVGEKRLRISSFMAVCAWFLTAAVAANDSSLTKGSRDEVAFCGRENPRVRFEGTTDRGLVEKICQEAVQVAAACRSGRCKIEGMDKVRETGMQSKLDEGKVLGVVFRKLTPSFTDVEVIFGRMKDARLSLYFVLQDGTPRVDRWGVSLP